ncbi:hypothetical protein DX888_19480 [Vibrio alginolyticus]|nr:hypothetical protein [Vibrio alginolyticus]
MFSPKFEVKINGADRVFNVELLSEFAKKYDFYKYTGDRFSWFFILQVIMYHDSYGIEPAEILEAIKELEGVKDTKLIKDATEFKRPPLKGLWHKHYFSARFLAKNLQIHHGKNGVKRVIEKHLANGETLTDEVIRKMGDDLITNAFESRADLSKLTGEWIVFAKYNNENYYLALGEHESNDEHLFKMISSTCIPQFDFLDDILNIKG